MAKTLSPNNRATLKRAVVVELGGAATQNLRFVDSFRNLLLPFVPPSSVPLLLSLGVRPRKISGSYWPAVASVNSELAEIETWFGLGEN